MPKILVDNSKTKKQYKTYAIKTCPICGSVIEVSEQEAMLLHSIENNTFECECPCGNRLVFYKYFKGEKYSQEDYVKCVGYFYNDVTNMLWEDLRYIPIGYGKEYINLNHTEIISTPMEVKLKIYINEYEDRNWDNCISNNVFYKQYIFNLLKLSDDLSFCAIYSQALSDYIICSMHNVCLQEEGDIDLKLKNINNDKLIAFFRNGDIEIDEYELRKLLAEKYQENKTTVQQPHQTAVQYSQ